MRTCCIPGLQIYVARLQLRLSTVVKLTALSTNEDAIVEKCKNPVYIFFLSLLNPSK
jgi:hypothetical protein